MNIEVECFKQEEKKLVVLRNIQGEDRVVDFDASIIYEDEYDSVFKDLFKVNRQIEKNYKEYFGGRIHLKVELDSLVYVGNFSFLSSRNFLQYGNYLNHRGLVMRSILWKSQNREEN